MIIAIIIMITIVIVISFIIIISIKLLSKTTVEYYTEAYHTVD